MKKVYIARRIPKLEPELILPIKKEMGRGEVFKAYVKKVKITKSYIYNGPWILRPPLSEDMFTLNNMPEELRPLDIWEMVKVKIESSDIVLGIIGSKAFGTIAETGYACKCTNIAVYVLPEKNVTREELEDLWFIFQIAQTTENLWSNNDIKAIKEFSEYGIYSVDQYRVYISGIIPRFMQK